MTHETTLDGLGIRAASAADRAAIAGVLRSSWGATSIAVHDSVYAGDELPALIAERHGEIVGLLTHTTSNADGLEVVTLDALRRRSGIGSALMDAAVEVAREQGARRLWLVTTNDNLDALRFYQRRGLRIVAVDAGAVDRARTRKPSIPWVGEYGIALHDELTLELRW
jgi:GNAT superfamily N-acetyltransferase